MTPRVSRLAAVIGRHTTETLPFDPVTSHSALVASAEGYFNHAGGTGGQGGTVIYVTNLDDSGTGSLRDSLTQTGPRIILFEDGIDGTINLSDQILCQSNKTVWGRHRDGSAADIFINPDINSNSAFAIHNNNGNFIFANLKGDADGAADDNAPDWIEMFSGGHTVWAHQITMTNANNPVSKIAVDGFVDCALTAGSNLTVSWCSVTDWDNVHLVRENSECTFHHNIWRRNTGRHPKCDLAKAHCYNNWVDDWGDGADTGHGMWAANTGSEVLAENNIFTANVRKIRAIRANGGGVWGDGGNTNVFENGATTDPVNPSTVFTPPYSYTLESVATTAQQTDLKNSLIADAGWQSSFS